MKLWQNPAKLYADLRLKTKLSLYVFFFSLWLIIVGSFGIYSAYKTSIGIGNAYRNMRQAILLTAIKSDSLYLRADLASGEVAAISHDIVELLTKLGRETRRTAGTPVPNKNI